MSSSGTQLQSCVVELRQRHAVWPRQTSGTQCSASMTRILRSALKFLSVRYVKRTSELTVVAIQLDPWRRSSSLTVPANAAMRRRAVIAQSLDVNLIQRAHWKAHDRSAEQMDNVVVLGRIAGTAAKLKKASCRRAHVSLRAHDQKGLISQSVMSSSANRIATAKKAGLLLRMRDST